MLSVYSLKLYVLDADFETSFAFSVENRAILRRPRLAA
jgi:hypothetical protein